MPKECTICINPKRDKVDLLLTKRIPVRNIAKQTGFGYLSIQRHKEHIKKAVALARDKSVVKQGKAVYEQFQEMWDEAVAEYNKAPTSMARATWFREKRCLFEMAVKLGLQQKEKLVYRGCDPAILEIINQYLPEAVQKGLS